MCFLSEQRAMLYTLVAIGLLARVTATPVSHIETTSSTLTQVNTVLNVMIWRCILNLNN